MPKNIEAIFPEISFRKSKWLLGGIYHLRRSSQNDQYFFDNIDKALDIYCPCDKIVLARDFNVQEGERLLDTFLYQGELHSINENPTCYKNSNNPSNINLILTNC